jgi:hypothetical protein
MKAGDAFTYVEIDRRMRLKQILTDGLIFAEDRHRWWAVMRQVTNLRVAENFMTTSVTVSVSGMTLLHGVRRYNIK